MIASDKDAEPKLDMIKGLLLKPKLINTQNSIFMGKLDKLHMVDNNLGSLPK